MHSKQLHRWYRPSVRKGVWQFIYKLGLSTDWVVPIVNSNVLVQRITCYWTLKKWTQILTWIYRCKLGPVRLHSCSKLLSVTTSRGSCCGLFNIFKMHHQTHSTDECSCFISMSSYFQKVIISKRSITSGTRVRLARFNIVRPLTMVTIRTGMIC